MLTPTQPGRQSRETTRTHPQAEEAAHHILLPRSEAVPPQAAILSQPGEVQAARTLQDHHIAQEAADLHTAAVVPIHQVHLQVHLQAHLPGRLHQDVHHRVPHQAAAEGN